ncbi:MAG: hypothetical protein NC131_20170, partial [Roseburia sp.]|nr:hypothetical protein [Roseburia sp.]
FRPRAVLVWMAAGQQYSYGTASGQQYYGGLYVDGVSKGDHDFLTVDGTGFYANYLNGTQGYVNRKGSAYLYLAFA